MAVKWTKKALVKLGAIVKFIGEDNPERGDSFALEIREKVNRLVEFPGMGRAGCVPGTRELVVHEHYIVPYTVRGGHVIVLSVRHTSMRLPRRY